MLCAFVHDKCDFSRYKVLACFCIFSGRLHRLHSLFGKLLGHNEGAKWFSRSWTVAYWQKVSSRKRIRTCVVWYDYFVPDRTRCSCQGKGRKTLDISDQVRLARLQSSYKAGFLRQSRAERSERARGMWGLWYRRYLYTIVFGRCHLNAS